MTFRIVEARWPDDRAAVESLFREYVGSLAEDISFQNVDDELAGRRVPVEVDVVGGVGAGVAQRVALDGEPPQRINPVDVDEMGWPRQPERHDRNEALAARQHASVARGDFGQKRHRLVDRSRRVVSEGSSLHFFE